jgi:molybdate transport system substrate-binding protein
MNVPTGAKIDRSSPGKGVRYLAVAGAVLGALLLSACGASTLTPTGAPATEPPTASAATDTPLPPTDVPADTPTAGTPVTNTEDITPTAPATASTLNVFAAASLQDVFTEMGKNFETANPGVKVALNFAGSQQLAQQIAQGAPADVFASANKTQMTAAIKTGRIVSGTEKVFVRNRLVVIVPVDNPGKVQSLQDLAKPGLKLVLAAKEVPVGQYALDFLTKTLTDTAFGADYRGAVLKNVVSYEDNVRAVLSKVVLGEADAGIVYTTDVTPDAAPKVTRIDIPDALNTVAVYPIAALAESKQADLAGKFVAYVLSDEGQQILASYGFIPASGK